MNPSTLLFLKIILTLLSPLHFFMNFRICLSKLSKILGFCKKKKIQVEFCTEPIDQFGECCHPLNSVKSSDIYEHGVYFNLF